MLQIGTLRNNGVEDIEEFSHQCQGGLQMQLQTQKD